MVKTKVPVKVPGRSSFDKSYKNILTTKVGTITPLVCKFIIPGSNVHLKIALSASLPPLASDCFMRCALKTEAFFVPMRLLYGGTESWLTGSLLHDYNANTDVRAELPRIYFTSSHWNTEKTYLGPCSLADYLGARVDVANSMGSGASDSYLNIFPFLAYHRVYHDWYRNAKVQTPVFGQPIELDLHTSGVYPAALPFVARGSIMNFELSDTLMDGERLGNLRQRNYGDDYFTIGSPSAQMGSAQSVSTSGNTFTIAALRAANSLQQFAERSNLGSPRLQDYVRSHYGCDLRSGIAQRSVLLGSASFDVYSKGIEGTTTSTATNNPFTSVGARYGNAFASGSDFVCDFEANEPGYLFVNATLVPEANYSTGIDKHLRSFTQAGSQVDIPDPLLENVGNEPVYASELNGELAASLGSVCSYVPRYTRHKTGLNEVHGLLISGQSLASFVAQRYFAPSSPVAIGSGMLKIPTTALDNVTAVSSALSTYGVWIDSFIDFKVAEPLSECAIPSLQDPAYEHGKSVYVKINGSHI